MFKEWFKFHFRNDIKALPLLLDNAPGLCISFNDDDVRNVFVLIGLLALEMMRMQQY